MKNDQAKSVWPWNGKVENFNLFGIGKTKFKNKNKKELAL